MLNNSISNQTSYTLKSTYTNSSSKNTTKTYPAEPAENAGVVYTSSSNSKSEVELKNPYDEFKRSLSIAIEKSEAQIKSFQTLVSSIFKKQSNYSFLSSHGSNNLKDYFSDLKVDAETVQQAKDAISEDGYFGVNQTSERILNFAKAIAGNDPKKLQEMREAVEKGFNQVEKMWGGNLPEVCQKTYEKVMNTFDEWQETANLSTN